VLILVNVFHCESADLGLYLLFLGDSAQIGLRGKLACVRMFPARVGYPFKGS
jgi:hypothetical protein